ncbi:hypothetical protein LCI18_011266 [Fusarium solani-melongenae]|uniref:Uncharacterized protein n=1 Tax=Fusarium solani subsp. cucurbitae TaxID=2747967 RepID=A0ACD3ZGJ4_FUSSC|nr:hypothetical protein LCI18_011266 [Fusarium solani-melongenae]
MDKDDNDVSPIAQLDESHNGTGLPLEPFEVGRPPEEWGTISFDDLGFNWPDHLMQGESDHHQPALAASPNTNTAPDYELVNALQPHDEALAKHENTQSPKREAQEPPDLPGLPLRFRPEQSPPSITIQSHSDSNISRKSSTPSSTLNLTPGSSSASPWTLTRHGPENFQPHPAPHDFLSSTWRMGSLDAPRSENESHTDFSLLSADTSTAMGSYDLSDQELGESSWAWPRDTGLTDTQSGVQPLTNEPDNSFRFVTLVEQVTETSYSAPASTTRGSSLIIPVCLPPSLNQAPLGMLSDLGTRDRQQAKRKRDEDDAESRTQKRKLRGVGACLRCRIYKEKCDLNMPCSRCVQVAGSVKLFRQPCQRVDLTDVIPFRTGNARVGQTNSVFPKLLWSIESPIRTTSVTHFVEGVDVASLPTLSLMCRQFSPTQDDVLYEHYEDAHGNVMVVTCPPVACINIATPRTKRALEEYMQKIWPFAVREMLDTLKDEIYRQGLTEANRLASLSSNPIPMLQKALEILACVHLNFDTPILVGDTLDVPILRDKRSPIHGRYPVPSVLDFQLDTLCIHHMQKLMKAVSRALKQVIFSKERQSRWYEIFLTIFVLLVSIEQVYLTQCEYLRGASIATDGVNIFAQASPVTNHMLGLWRASAKYLLYHYRCVMKGTLPFSSSFNLKGEGYATLDTEAIKYIRNTAALVREREVELNDLRDRDLDNTSVKPLSWISELFLD